IGVASAVGLVIVLVFTLTALPALLAVTGRRIFWPFVPRAGQSVDPDRGFWAGLARRVTARPGLTIGVAIAGLAVLSMGLIGTQVGLSQDQQFRVSSESQTGLETITAHYPGGETNPIVIIADADHSDAVVDTVSAVTGVTRVTPSGASHGLAEITAVSNAAPQTEASYDVVRDVRAAVGDIDGADALVGGTDAQNLDIKDQSRTDLMTVAPVILAVIVVVLMVLL